MGTSSCAHDDNFFLLAKSKQIRVGRYQLSSLWMLLCRATPTNPLLTIMLPGSHKKKKKKQLQPQLLIVANSLLTTSQFRKACYLLRKQRRNPIAAQGAR
jgi:hypothetical protein